MDPMQSGESYRGLGRTAQDWSITPAAPEPLPTRASGRASEIVLVLCLGAFLLDTFAPWQRICLSFSSSFFSMNGCLSANAWSATGAGFGVAAGIAAILACMALVLHLMGAAEGPTADSLERVLVYTVVGTGAVKWLLVIDKAAAFGAWIGVVLLFAVAAIETVRARSAV
jgi:hypothetical protein